MEPERFDRITASLARTESRRRLLMLVAALPVGGGLGGLRDEDVTEAAHPVRRVQTHAAKRQKRRHHRLKQKRRGQRRNTHQNESKPENNNLDWSLIKYTSFTVEGQDRNGNRQPWPGLQVDFYYRIKGLGDNWSDLKFAWTSDISSSSASFAPEHYRIAAFVRGPDLQWPGYVEGLNPLIGSPWATIWRGGAINGGVYQGGEEFWPQSYGVGTRGAVSLKGGDTSAHNHPDIVIEVIRLDDTDTHKRFMLVVRPGHALDVCGNNVGC